MLRDKLKVFVSRISPPLAFTWVSSQISAAVNQRVESQGAIQLTIAHLLKAGRTLLQSVLQIRVQRYLYLT